MRLISCFAWLLPVTPSWERTEQASLVVSLMCREALAQARQQLRDHTHFWSHPHAWWQEVMEMRARFTLRKNTLIHQAIKYDREVTPHVLLKHSVCEGKKKKTSLLKVFLHTINWLLQLCTQCSPGLQRKFPKSSQKRIQRKRNTEMEQQREPPKVLHGPRKAHRFSAR